MKVEWVVVCQSCMIDRETGAVSMFFTLPGIKVESFPFVFPKISAVTLLRKEKGDDDVGSVDLRVSIEHKELFSGPIPYKFEQTGSTQQTININGMVFAEPGTYQFAIVLKGKVLDFSTITVVGPDAPSINDPPYKVRGAAQAKKVKTTKAGKEFIKKAKKAAVSVRRN